MQPSQDFGRAPTGGGAELDQLLGLQQGGLPPWAQQQQAAGPQQLQLGGGMQSNGLFQQPPLQWQQQQQQAAAQQQQPFLPPPPGGAGLPPFFGGAPAGLAPPGMVPQQAASPAPGGASPSPTALSGSATALFGGGPSNGSAGPGGGAGGKPPGGGPPGAGGPGGNNGGGAAGAAGLAGLAGAAGDAVSQEYNRYLRLLPPLIQQRFQGNLLRNCVLLQQQGVPLVQAQRTVQQQQLREMHKIAQVGTPILLWTNFQRFGVWCWVRDMRYAQDRAGGSAFVNTLFCFGSEEPSCTQMFSVAACASPNAPAAAGAVLSAASSVGLLCITLHQCFAIGLGRYTLRHCASPARRRPPSALIR